VWSLRYGNCNDLAQIERRKAEVALIGQLDTELQKNSDIVYTPARHNEITERMKPLVNFPPTTLRTFLDVDSPAETKFHGDIRTCRTDFNGATTSCIHAALEKHEAVHMGRYLKNSKLLHPDPFTMAEYITEERSAYQAEFDLLAQESARLLCDCPYYGVRMEVVTTVPKSKHFPAGERILYGIAPAEGPYVDVPLLANRNDTMTGDGEGRFHMIRRAELQNWAKSKATFARAYRSTFPWIHSPNIRVGFTQKFSPRSDRLRT
jgi:hypothetical protein